MHPSVTALAPLSQCKLLGCRRVLERGETECKVQVSRVLNAPAMIGCEDFVLDARAPCVNGPSYYPHSIRSRIFKNMCGRLRAEASPARGDYSSLAAQRELVGQRVEAGLLTARFLAKFGILWLETTWKWCCRPLAD